MSCEHEFAPWPGSQSRLFCRRCGIGKAVSFRDTPAEPRARRGRTTKQEWPQIDDARPSPEAQAEADLVRQMRLQGFEDEATLADLDQSVEDIIERRVPVDEADERIGVGTGL